MRHRHTPVLLFSALLSSAALAMSQVGVSRTASAASSSNAAVSAAVAPPTEADLLTETGSGDDVVRRLGAKFAEAARRNGLSDAELRAHLKDRAAHLDRKGRMFFVDSTVPQSLATETATGATTAAAGPAADYSQTFLLHSRPGSSRVIYLDFNGETVASTAWNASYTAGAPFVAEPFDTDGVPTSFSFSEQDTVQSVWQRVSEDYAAFDIDVTTQEPPADAITRSGSTDLAYGTRLLVTNTNSIYASCGCGGIAYVGTFDTTSSHAYYQPAFVFQKGVTSNAKYIAEAASHEVGHNLGLHHDGTSTAGYYNGQGSWAPIMGASYYKPITQFSRGDYADANNFEDDFAVIQSNGANLLTDDYGNAKASATSLGSPSSVSLSGVIATATDVDVFSFQSGSGIVTLGVTPAGVSPNLDLKLTLVNSADVVVGSVDPAATTVNYDVATGLGASLSIDVPAGTYYLYVEGVGTGSPTAGGYSDYGSIGRYTLSGSIPASTATTTPSTTTTVSPTTSTTLAPTTTTTTTLAPTTTTTLAPTTTTRAPATTTTVAPTTTKATTTTTTKVRNPKRR